MFSSVLAGFFILIASLLYLKTEPKWVGAVLFSIGLLSIMILDLHLFTGKVGYAVRWQNIFPLLLILIGNIIGSLPALLFHIESDIVVYKLQTPWYQTLILSIICGMLIYVSVDSYRQHMPWLTILAVPAFILCGAEHCIADMSFIFLTQTYSLQLLWFIPLVIVGNAIGSIILNIWNKWRMKNELQNLVGKFR